MDGSCDQRQLPEILRGNVQEQGRGVRDEILCDGRQWPAGP